MSKRDLLPDLNPQPDPEHKAVGWVVLILGAVVAAGLIWALIPSEGNAAPTQIEGE